MSTGDPAVALTLDAEPDQPERDAGEESADTPLGVLCGTLIDSFVVSGILVLPLPLLSVNTSDGMQMLPEFLLYGLVGAVLYALPALGNSWWVRRWPGVSSTGWFAGVCNFAAFSLVVGVTVGLLAGASHPLDGVVAGLFVVFFAGPVMAAAVTIGEFARRLSSRRPAAALLCGALATALWGCAIWMAL